MKNINFKNIIVIGILFIAFVSIFANKTNATGVLIKGQSFSSIYYLGSDNKRYVFPNDKTFLSWYENFNGITTVSDADLSSYQIGGNVTYRPGKKLVKIQTDPKVYAIDKNGTLRWVMTEDIANTLYGTNWNKVVDDVPDIFFANYKVGSPIASVSDYNPDAIMTAVANISSDKFMGAPDNIDKIQPVSVVPVQPIQISQPVVKTIKPVITSFSSDQNPVTSGDTVTFSWTSENTTSCKVADDLSDITVPFVGLLPNGSQTRNLQPTKSDYTFYLVCTDKDQNTVTQPMAVKYTKIPIIPAQPVVATPQKTPLYMFVWNSSIFPRLMLKDNWIRLKIENRGENPIKIDGLKISSEDVRCPLDGIKYGESTMGSETSMGMLNNYNFEDQTNVLGTLTELDRIMPISVTLQPKEIKNYNLSFDFNQGCFGQSSQGDGGPYFNILFYPIIDSSVEIVDGSRSMVNFSSGEISTSGGGYN